MGLWPKRCVAGTARLDFAGVTRGRRGWPPAALSQDRCVRGAVRSPRGSCRRSARPRGRRGIGLWPVGVALAGCPRFALARMSPRGRPPSPPVRFVSHGTCRVFTRRSRVRVPRFWRRCAASPMRTRTGRSNVAARGGAGLVVGGNIAEIGGVWQRLGGGAAGNCANAGSRCSRYVEGCAAPSHSGCNATRDGGGAAPVAAGRPASSRRCHPGLVRATAYGG